MFEDFCNRHRIRWRRIPTESTRTPDYEMFLARRKVIVEVKEISPNKDELAAQQIARQGGFAVVSSTPGDRVRAKISNAIPQLKAATKGRMAALLVLLDTGFAAEHTSPYNIRTAMHGLETHYLGVPQDRSSPTYLKDKEFGRGKKTTPSSNTSLSSIGIAFRHRFGNSAAAASHVVHLERMSCRSLCAAPLTRSHRSVASLVKAAARAGRSSRGSCVHVP